ncbi:unnamed protein product [Pedinophyceae sp. YPF-701]|nr:unnamed protein product [Pedinophyceae sp. YPF-701]
MVRMGRRAAALLATLLLLCLAGAFTTTHAATDSTALGTDSGSSSSSGVPCAVVCEGEHDGYAPKVCQLVYIDSGSGGVKVFARVLQWSSFVISLSLFTFFSYQYFVATCGWEVIYVGALESMYYILEIFFESYPPFTVYNANGATAAWLRYMSWLLTCPVMLIHLSNITGLGEQYNSRTMRLITFDQGTLIMGVTAALATGVPKIIFFLIGVVFGGTTFYTAAQIYIESYHVVPAGICRQLVRYMTWAFFLSWPIFPLNFLAGPEGFGFFNSSGSVIAQSVCDLISKNLWGMLGWYLHYKVHEHVVMHGVVTKRMEVDFLGTKRVIEAWADEDDPDATRQASHAVSQRRSIRNMRTQLKSRGRRVRPSLDEDAEMPSHIDQEMIKPMVAGPFGPVKSDVALGTARGRLPAAPAAMAANAGWKTTPSGPKYSLPSSALVVVAAQDEGTVAFFRSQFEQLPCSVTVEHIQNDSEAMQCLGYYKSINQTVDLVLLQPSVAQANPAIVQAVKSNFGVPVVAFSSSSASASQLGADDNIEGPTLGTPFNKDVLAQALSKHHGGARSAVANPMYSAAPATPMTPGSGAMTPGGAQYDPAMVKSMMDEIARLKAAAGLQ